jgi:hypothetical protein
MRKLLAAHSLANHCHFRRLQTDPSRRLLSNLLIVFDIEFFGVGNIAGRGRQHCHDGIAADDEIS